MPTDLSLLRGCVLVCLLVFLVHGASAAEEEAPVAPVAGESQPAESESSPEVGKREEDAAPADAVVGQMGEVSLEEFVPSEEIGADGAVSFPVDI